MDYLHAMTAGDWGRVLSMPLVIGFAIFAGWLGERLNRPASPRNAISSRNYRVPPHQHVIDFERSNLMPLEGGAVLAQCCMQGCDVTVTIGRGVTEMLIEQEEFVQ